MVSLISIDGIPHQQLVSFCQILVRNLRIPIGAQGESHHHEGEQCVLAPNQVCFGLLRILKTISSPYVLILVRENPLEYTRIGMEGSNK